MNHPLFLLVIAQMLPRLQYTNQRCSVTDNLFAQGVITDNLVSVSFEPTQSLSITNGELTFGGTDSSKFIGSISFAWVIFMVGPLFVSLISQTVLSPRHRHPTCSGASTNQSDMVHQRIFWVQRPGLLTPELHWPSSLLVYSFFSCVENNLTYGFQMRWNDTKVQQAQYPIMRLAFCVLRRLNLQTCRVCSSRLMVYVNRIYDGTISDILIPLGGFRIHCQCSDLAGVFVSLTTHLQIVNVSVYHTESAQHSHWWN